MQEREISLRLLDLPSELLRGLAEGRPVAELAAMLCRMAEASAPGRIASVLRMGPDGALHPLTAPSSPPDMLVALDISRLETSA